MGVRLLSKAAILGAKDAHQEVVHVGGMGRFRLHSQPERRGTRRISVPRSTGWKRLWSANSKRLF